MSKRWLLAAGGIVFVAILLVLQLSGFNWSSLGTYKAVDDTPTTHTKAQLTVPQAQQLAADLHSQDTAKVQQAVAMPPGQTVPADVVQQLQALRSVTVVPSSLHDYGDGTATAVFVMVDASGASTQWQAYLAKSGDHWQITETVKVS